MLHLIGNLRNNLQCRNGQSGACIAFTHNATGALRYVLNQVFLVFYLFIRTNCRITGHARPRNGEPAVGVCGQERHWHWIADIAWEQFARSPELLFANQLRTIPEKRCMHPSWSVRCLILGLAQQQRREPQLWCLLKFQNKICWSRYWTECIVENIKLTAITFIRVCSWIAYRPHSFEIE